MCNAWNHPPGCTCGWGGEGHLGRRTESHDHSTIRTAAPLPRVWRFRDEDFCRPSICPNCGRDVFFVRHNGGSVWLDDLGYPWPKHSCFDNHLNTVAMQQRLLESVTADGHVLLGVVLAVVPGRVGESWRLTMRLSDGQVSEFSFAGDVAQCASPGQLLVASDDKKWFTLLLPERLAFDLGGSDAEQDWCVFVKEGKGHASFAILPHQTLLFNGELTQACRDGVILFSRPSPLGLRASDRLRLRLRGDGKDYKVMILQGSPKHAVLVQYSFVVQTHAGQWVEFEIPILDFKMHVLGRPHEKRGSDHVMNIRSVGFSVSDGRPGTFSLELGLVEIKKMIDRPT